MPVVALEGLSFVGKSTLAARLWEADPNVVLVPEYHDHPGRAAVLPSSAVATSTEDELRRVSQYLELDRRRWADVPGDPERLVVLDRCHLSILAYCAALDECLDRTASGGATELVNAALDSPLHPLRAPDMIVYLDVSHEDAYERFALLGVGMPPELRTERFIAALIASYRRLMAASTIPVVNVEAASATPQLLKPLLSCARRRAR